MVQLIHFYIHKVCSHFGKILQNVYMGNIHFHGRPATHRCTRVSALTITHVWTGKLHVFCFYLKQTQYRDTVFYTSSYKLFSRLPPFHLQRKLWLLFIESLCLSIVDLWLRRSWASKPEHTMLN